MNVLVINAGSSSLKYQLFDMSKKEVLAKGLCERIGIDGKLVHQKGEEGEKHKFDITMKNHNDAIKSVIDILVDEKCGVIKNMSEINAVGHRVVHGGEFFSKSVKIDAEVIKAIEACITLAPLHNTPNLIGIRACYDIMGKDIPQVAVFDTAFHQTMPEKNYIYAIPYKYYEKYKVRRYGFHGTSHGFVADEASAFLGKPLSELKLITCHLGNGSSICAIKNGKSYDTSMGFTPLDGLPMGTRSGSIDPAIIKFISTQENLTADEVINILNTESGMLGVSELSSDFRDIEEAMEKGNKNATLARTLFVQSVKKLIGSYIADMNGVDAIIFTAGVGENDADVRSKVCEDMDFFGIKIDENLNNVRGVLRDISSKDATVKTLIIPTNEELVIAEDTFRILS